jgi:hypothetical protein
MSGDLGSERLPLVLVEQFRKTWTWPILVALLFGGAVWDLYRLNGFLVLLWGGAAASIVSMRYALTRNYDGYVVELRTVNGSQSLPITWRRVLSITHSINWSGAMPQPPTWSLVAGFILTMTALILVFQKAPSMGLDTSHVKALADQVLHAALWVMGIAILAYWGLSSSAQRGFAQALEAPIRNFSICFVPAGAVQSDEFLEKLRRWVADTEEHVRTLKAEAAEENAAEELERRYR